MKSRNVLVRVMVLGTAVSMLAACGLDIPKEIPTSYETIKVKESNIVYPMKFSAKLKGQSDVTISPQISGQLMKICVTEGQQVSRGQTLFIIDSRNAQHELESAQANLQAAQANLQAAQAQASSAKLEFESNKNLFDKKIVSSYMLENSRNNYNQALAAVSQAKSAITQAQAGVNRAKVNLGFCTITSPVSGVIGEIPVFAGDQVSPMTQLTIVSGNRQMEAWFSITESVIEAGVSSGLKKTDLTAHLASLPDVRLVMKNGTEYPYKGRITSHLFSGAQCTVVLPISRSNVMVVPQTAVVRLQDKSLVYKVMPDSTAKAITVTTTDAGNGKDVIINTGLGEGDCIVAVGANNVQEGQKVVFRAGEEIKE